jgi:predicted ATPase
MFNVGSIKITGFWGRYTIETALQPGVTFFIGENGTGKTTLINLIAAALAADFQTLDRLAFRSIEISLRSKKDRRKPKIFILKRKDESTGIESIDYGSDLLRRDLRSASRLRI